MKKILVGSNLILLVLFLMAYTGKTKNNLPPPQDRDMHLGIDKNLARHMLITYRDAMWKQRNINGGTGKDARSVWFSLAKLKAFINDIENNAKSNGCIQDTFKLGIRIYYASYPDSGLIRVNKYDKYFTEHKLPSEYKNHHTVVLVPTIYDDVDSLNYDFDPRYFEATGRCVPMPIQKVLDEKILYSGSQGTNINAKVGLPPSIIPNSKVYMIMPDNLDNKRFFGLSSETAYANSNSNTSKQKGSDGIEQTLDNDTEFTNGGTLIPPPYPDDLTGARLSKGWRRFHVPKSGASLMRWVDNTNKIGLNEVNDNVKQGGTSSSN